MRHAAVDRQTISLVLKSAIYNYMCIIIIEIVLEAHKLIDT